MENEIKDQRQIKVYFIKEYSKNCQYFVLNNWSFADNGVWGKNGKIRTFVPFSNIQFITIIE